MPDDRPLPLEGIRICDFSWIVAGPQATRILADLGAEVIKVESETRLDSLRLGLQSDPARPSVNGSGMHSNFNRNKLSVTPNIHHPEGREVVKRLIANSDAVVENYSAGTFERMGFGWDRLQELNPSIIYLSLSGYGHLGRDAAYVTWGPTAQAHVRHLGHRPRGARDRYPTFARACGARDAARPAPRPPSPARCRTRSRRRSRRSSRRI